MGLWVFGYGSLLWDPGFAPVERASAALTGWHRSFCMLSIHHRGTEAEPGLVLALDASDGAVCRGAALRVAAGAEDEVLAMLRARELVSSAYLERELDVRLADGREVRAVTYVIDPGHRQYCRFDLETQARMIARARGGRGENRDYLYATAAHLADEGMGDPDLDWLVSRVRALTSGQMAT
jgi:cation transport protein ChaC